MFFNMDEVMTGMLEVPGIKGRILLVIARASPDSV
jgi:hypothetical protein